jgi:hypothetical protein
MKLSVGDKVVKSAWWKPNTYDQWGRGEGVGTVIGHAHDHKIRVQWENCTTDEPIPWLTHKDEVDYRTLQEIPCIGCGFLVKKLSMDDTDDQSQPTSAMWNDGVIFKDGAGYGSKLDGNIYLIAVCDNCLANEGLKVGRYL